MKSFPVFSFKGQEADAVKNGPHELSVRQDPFAGVSMGCLASEPKGTILLVSIPWPRTIPERIFFEQLTHRSLLFENSEKGERKKEEFEKSWLTRNSFVRSQK
jgi:hypothetical protein